ncbi:MAG: hypothetical protein JWM98_857 [Thermoleophilia bacterium]|nr:hypothetical protein [Thermoleophilia bacterium]
MADGSDKERLDRELIELLNEIRVALPGVQVLFAFLLAVPFQARFAKVTDFQRDVYFVALLLTLVASVLLIAPSAYHRVNFRAYDKQRLVKLSGRLALAGIYVLGASMASVLLLISDVLFSRAEAWTVAGVATALVVGLWVVLPLTARQRREAREH